MHNRRWKSVYCVTKRDAFRGTAPINLTDRLHQFIVQNLNVTFLAYLLAITLTLCILAVLEIKWSGIELEKWWRNEQFWLIGGTSAHLAAVLQGLLKVVAGIEISFTLTSKSGGDDVDDEFADLYIVKWSSLMIPPITIMMVNLIAIAVGVSRTIYNTIPQWSRLLGGIFFSFWVVAHLYPFAKGLMGRRGKTPTIVFVWSEAISVISCWYEDKTEWGQRVGWIYGSVTEDVVTGYRMHNRRWKSVYCVTKRDAFRGTAPINLTDRLHQFIVQNLNVTFLAYLLDITLTLCILAVLEIKWSGIELEKWWRNEQFWLIGGTSAHLAAVLQGLLKVVAGIEISFTLTSKSGGDDVDDEFADLYIVKWSSLMIPPITIMMVNLIAIAVGVSRTIYSTIPQWSHLLGGVFFSF
ncbi:hypothetical protein RYX36_009325 [Vicia faba]